VGTTVIKDVIVTEGDGQVLKFNLEHLEEKGIKWFFPALSDGQQTVVAQFTIPNISQGSRTRNQFSLPLASTTGM